jgi:hypothetical protein
VKVHSEDVGAIVLGWRDAGSLFFAKPETQKKFSIPPPLGKHTVASTVALRCDSVLISIESGGLCTSPARC